MSYNPAHGFPRVVPSLFYTDLDAASRWLCEVAGFREILRWSDPDGVPRHIDLELNGAVVMLDGGEPGYAAPAPDRQPSSQVLVWVDDVDAVHDRAGKADGTVVRPPRDTPWGLRQFVAADPEGHRWEFTQHVRDVPAEEWGATATP